MQWTRPNLVAAVLIVALSGAAVLWSSYNRRTWQRQPNPTARDYGEAAAQGNPQAQYALAYYYARGDGVPKDERESLRWLQLSAGQGYLPAENRLARLYSRGETVPEDRVEAARWYRKAAAQGDPAAERYLGFAYRWGHGVPEDHAESLAWYRKAAQNGDAPAQAYLAHLYRTGREVPASYLQSVRWYLPAVAQTLPRVLRRTMWTLLAVPFLLAFAFVPDKRWRSHKSLTLLISGAAVLWAACSIARSPTGSHLIVAALVVLLALTTATSVFRKTIAQ